MPSRLSDTATANAGKAEVLSAAFISVFTDAVPSHFKLEAGLKEQRNSSIKRTFNSGVS